MMFNNRRQSRDREVISKAQKIIGDNPLFLSEYSKKLFPDGIVFSETNSDGYYFIENPDDIIPDFISEIYLFKWNRDYPADNFFTMDMSKFELINSEEFVGYSHEKITLEIYKKGC